MKNKVINTIVIILTLCITLFNFTGNIIHSLNYDINRLPVGEFMFSTMSKDTTKTVKIYKVTVPQLGTGIRGELIYKKDGQEVETNIYWQTNEDNATVSWIDNTTVQINDIIIDVQGSPYDCRSKIDIPDVTAKSKGLI